MILKPDRDNPSFILGPVNNNRTAWRPFGLPVIMVVPHKYNVDGTAVADSGVFNVKVYIEDVPSEALVAGHDHIGMKHPDRELYAETLDALELADRFIYHSDMTITRDGNDVPHDEAVTGDIIRYTTVTGIELEMEYISHADYYDLSDIAIDVELLPSDTYNIVYECQYYSRVVDIYGGLLCININNLSIAALKFEFAHPGEVMDEFYRLTPPQYLTNTSKSLDTTVAFYRPFTDALQDVADEQLLLESINWVFDTPPEAIPYLSQLLGWNMPYFPESLDQMRKAVLRRTVELQNLKGSRRAIINLFKLFGFEILISNLWWSSDGKMLIRPDADVPLDYAGERITTVKRCQTDLLINGWYDDKYSSFNIPLLKRPQEKSELDDFSALKDSGPVVIDVYLVSDGSGSQGSLELMANDLLGTPLQDANVNIVDGLPISNQLDSIPSDGVLGHTRLAISGRFSSVEILIDDGFMVPSGVTFDRDDNKISVTLAGIPYEDCRVYVFATYAWYDTVVPDVIANLQSNRFDITITAEESDEYADPPTIEFAIEFLMRLKAFHSLLHLIRYSVKFSDSYEVTDFCVGGDVAQRYDTDLGMIQVPPAIVPNIPVGGNPCALSPEALGYKDSDLELRRRKMDSISNELEAWSELDDVEYSTSDLTRIAPNEPRQTESMKYNQYGLDRVVGVKENGIELIWHPDPNANSVATRYTSHIDMNPHDSMLRVRAMDSSNNDGSAFMPMTREYTKPRDPLLQLDGITDYCYKGRVDDELLYGECLKLDEHHVWNACPITMGYGVYYTYPAKSVYVGAGNKNRSIGSSSRRAIYSGCAPSDNIEYYLTNYAEGSMMGRLYRGYGRPNNVTLHYSNRINKINIDQKHHLALIRPPLNITKPTLHFPGCRFPTLGALEDDFTHPTHRARPWDDRYSTYCGPNSPDPSMLNMHMTVGTDGNEYLAFDDEPFAIQGNGLPQDIPSLGNHTLPTGWEISPSDVVHRVYMDLSDGHPALSMDEACDYDSSISDGMISPSRQLFDTYDGTEDYACGYPCDTGYHVSPAVDYGTYVDVFDGLGMPYTGSSFTYLISLVCGILVGYGVRLDCDSGDDIFDNCGADSIEMEMKVRRDESIGIYDIRLDGTIQTLLETV